MKGGVFVNTPLAPLSLVMPGFRPGIHEFGATIKKLVDPRAKPGDDDPVGGNAQALQSEGDRL